MTHPKIHEIAAGLHARRTGTGWTARCPAHEDGTPSLAIRERGGRILVHCHAGCTQAQVLSALRLRGLWPERAGGGTSCVADPDRDADTERAFYWRKSAVMLAEWLLEEQPMTDPARVPLTTLLRILELGDETVLVEYRAWKTRDPERTAALVHAGRLSQARLERRLAEWIEGGMHGKL